MCGGGLGLGEAYRKELVRRIVKNLLDLQVLRLVERQPLWGYMIKKRLEADFEVKIRHGALYPLLNGLERKGFLVSRKERKDGRVRKVYSLTGKGREYLRSYYAVLREQVEGG
jgi:PadR family transcriptional regulator PadR